MGEVTIEQAYATAAAHHGAGRVRQAEQIYRQILALNPNHPDALHSLGLIALQTGHHHDACILVERAIVINGACADYHNTLGDARFSLKQLDQADVSYRRALMLRPDYVQAQNNIGNILFHRGRFDDAALELRRAIAMDPPLAEAFYNMGSVLAAQRDYPAAVAMFERATQLSPGDKNAHHNLGAVLLAMGHFAQAEKSMNRALALDPSNADTWNNLADLYKAQGKLDEAIKFGRKAVQLAPQRDGLHSNLLMAMNYHQSLSINEIIDEHQRWAERHERPLRDQIRPHANDPSPDRRLRIGYLSPDFREHPVGRFIEPVIRGHNRINVEIFCYNNALSSDAITRQIKTAADHWREITGLSDARVAEIIRDDQIDILIDLAGHTARHRLLVFARKPAPVQATYLGYVNTTGLRSMDYIIVGPHLLPDPSLIRVEKICHLPKTEVCYQPRVPAIDVAELPAFSRGQVTFACMNGLMKISPATWQTWAKILHRLPNSRLLLQASALPSSAEIKRLLSPVDIDPDRVQFIARQPLAAYYALHNQFDIALDPFPHCGGTTTCDALWMGVPVITCPGSTFVSRIGLSLLSSLGMNELAASSPDHYIDLAVNLANDIPRLAALRRTLRSRMESSPLMDVAGFARDMETAFRMIWQTWCAGRDAASDANPSSPR